MTQPMRLAVALIVSVLAAGCLTVPAMTKADVRNKTVSQSEKKANYLKLARYWDSHATKGAIDFVGASFLAVWESEGRAEITYGNGPYYGMIELIALDKSTTLIKCYAWGSLGEKIIEWRDLIEHAPEE